MRTLGERLLAERAAVGGRGASSDTRQEIKELWGRSNQAARMTWEQVHLERMEIEVPAGTDKTQGEYIVPVQPNLRAWLEQMPPEQRTRRVFYSREFFTRAYRAAGWKTWPQDVLRRGYASYRLKILGSFGLLADEMGNSEKVIRERYMRSISPAAAAAYFEIRPK